MEPKSNIPPLLMNESKESLRSEYHYCLGGEEPVRMRGSSASQDRVEKGF